MFSPDVDDHSFSPNHKNKNNKKLAKRKWSYENSSDEEESEINSFKPKRSLNGKHDSTGKQSRLSNSTLSTSTNSTLPHPALSGKKPGISHSTPINDVRLTPPRGRRSLIVDKLVLHDGDELNDDVEELRAERENQISAQDSALEPEKGLKSLEIVAHCLDNELSTEQLAAHLASCIELNAANKINISNAFNLKLIDYMVVLLKRNDKTMKDFPTMSCSLDASTRIYACRVDNVHAGVMELVTGLAGTLNKHRKTKSKDPGNQNDGDQSGNDSDDGDRATGQGRTRKRKAVLASSEKAVSRNNIEVAHWMTRKAIEPNFTVLFNTAKMTQSTDAGLSLLKYTVPMIPEKTIPSKAPRETSTVDIELPEIPTSRLSLYGSSFHFDWDEEAEQLQQQQSQSSIINEEVNQGEVLEPNESTMENGSVVMNSFAGEIPDAPSDNDDVDHFMPDDPELEAIDTEETKPDITTMDMITDQERRCNLQQNKKRKHVDALSLVNSKLILADDENDYSYMNTDVLPLIWAGPDHWKPVLKRGKPSVAVAECAEKKIKKLKKKAPEGLCYDDLSMVDGIYGKKVNSMLQSKAVKKWDESKVTYPIQKEFKVNFLFRSFLRKTLFWKPLVKTEKDGDDIKVETEYADEFEEISSDDNFATDGNPVLQEFDDDFDRDDPESVRDDQSDGDFEEHILNPVAEQEEINDPSPPEVSFSDKLVPVPRIVDCGTITYATVPKRVNMKKLKEACWNLMDLDGDKENQNCNFLKDDHEKTAQFSKLYLELPKHLPSDSRNDLSPALAFISILHLANEKMLRLCPVDKEFDGETNSDFLIKRFIT